MKIAAGMYKMEIEQPNQGIYIPQARYPCSLNAWAAREHMAKSKTAETLNFIWPL